MSDYTFEYVTALLMNLALRTAGKVKCEDPQVMLNAGMIKIVGDIEGVE